METMQRKKKGTMMMQKKKDDHHRSMIKKKKRRDPDLSGELSHDSSSIFASSAKSRTPPGGSPTTTTTTGGRRRRDHRRSSSTGRRPPRSSPPLEEVPRPPPSLSLITTGSQTLEEEGFKTLRDRDESDDEDTTEEAFTALALSLGRKETEEDVSTKASSDATSTPISSSSPSSSALSWQPLSRRRGQSSKVRTTGAAVVGPEKHGLALVSGKKKLDKSLPPPSLHSLPDSNTKGQHSSDHRTDEMGAGGEEVAPPSAQSENSSSSTSRWPFPFSLATLAMERLRSSTGMMVSGSSSQQEGQAVSAKEQQERRSSLEGRSREKEATLLGSSSSSSEESSSTSEGEASSSEGSKMNAKTKTMEQRLRESGGSGALFLCAVLVLAVIVVGGLTAAMGVENDHAPPAWSQKTPGSGATGAAAPYRPGSSSGAPAGPPGRYSAPAAAAGSSAPYPPGSQAENSSAPRTPGGDVATGRSSGSSSGRTQGSITPTTTALCPSLVVPSGAEFVFAIKDVVRPVRQEQLFSIVDLQGLPLSRVVISEQGGHPGILLQTLLKQNLAFISTERAWLQNEEAPARMNDRDGRTFDICRPNGEVFGFVQCDGSSGRYVVKQKGTQKKILTFHGDFKNHAVNVVNAQGQLISCTERCQVEFDAADRFAYYQVRVAPNVDAGLVMCGLLSISKFGGWQ